MPSDYGCWSVDYPEQRYHRLAAVRFGYALQRQLDARTAGGHIAFTGASSFYSLNATASSGISVSASITTSQGLLALDGNYDVAGSGAPSLSSGVGLSAKTTLLLNPRASGIVSVSGSGIWSAEQNIQLFSGVRVSGSAATLSILADSDASGAGALLFASGSNITVDSSSYSAIYLRYADVQWSSGFVLSARSASVLFDTSTASSTSFGGSGRERRRTGNGDYLGTDSVRRCALHRYIGPRR